MPVFLEANYGSYGYVYCGGPVRNNCGKRIFRGALKFYEYVYCSAPIRNI